MRTVKLTLSYDGTAYSGWQIQPDRTTVQSVLEKAIEKVTQERSRTIASGRTDAGVHALGQVVGFRTTCRLAPEVLQRALNAELPRDVAVIEVSEAPEGFHAIRDARRKRYRYLIEDSLVRNVFNRHYCWHYVYGRLNVEAMHGAAQQLLGKHDFSSFESSGAPRESSVRTVYDIGICRDASGQGGQIRFEIEADGFLYNMVRAIVGSLVEIGRGTQDQQWLTEAIEAADRSAAGPTAPPQGLFLVRVDYD